MLWLVGLLGFGLCKLVEVSEERGLLLEVPEDLKHSEALHPEDLLGVSAGGYWLVLVQGVVELFEVLVLDVLHVEPVQAEASHPLLALAPLHALVLEIHSRGHLGHCAEGSTVVVAEEKVNRVSSILLGVLVHTVQLLIAFLGA